jgi:hypothetical protein
LTTPITGPFTKDVSLWDIPEWQGGGNVYKRYRMHREWYRQAKPHTLPLQFDSMTVNANSVYDSSGPYGTFHGSWTDSTAVSADFPAMDGGIYNQAYARFIDRWKNAVELGVATAEGREAVSMITQRFGQLARFTRHLATGRLGLAAGDLGLTWVSGDGSLPRKGKSRLPPRIQKMIDRREATLPPREVLRNFSQLYLEFHFGWSPLLKDIHDACETLNAPFKAFHVRSSAAAKWADPLNRNTVVNDGTWITTETRDGSYVQTVRLQADLVIANPNVAMLQQFGIANPAAVAWELIPFSFVLDWFVNVGDYLNSLTDFLGVELKNAQRMTFTRYTGTYLKNSKPLHPTSDNSHKYVWNSLKASCSRRVGLGAGPTIRLRASKPWGIRRGLAAASLLMQRFPRQIIDANAISLAKSRTAFRANVFPQFNGKYW